MNISRNDFPAQIFDWSKKYSRFFPWQATNPYGVLISEIMLRRTRASQVVPVFEKFMKRFPDPIALASAPQDEIEKVVRPLGLAWRHSTFKQLAEVLLQQYQGNVPMKIDELRELPGVGDYVAAAVRIFAFDLPAILVDTNTVRVAARYFGFPYHAESRRNRGVRTQVERILDFSRPRQSARALLDFAATICTARLPRCTECPVANYCVFYGSASLPSSKEAYLKDVHSLNPRTD